MICIFMKSKTTMGKTMMKKIMTNKLKDEGYTYRITALLSLSPI